MSKVTNHSECQSKKLRPPLIGISSILDFFAESMKNNGQEVRLIQVGANDGKTNDPVHKYITHYKWKSLLLEPQPHVFNKELKETYKGYEHVALENAAIAAGEGELPFFRIGFSEKRWATGLSGFDRRSLEYQINKGYVDRKAKEHGDIPPTSKDDYIIEVKVPTISFDQLIKKHNFDKVDFLCIDTEGYDYQVLKHFDFSQLRPKVILFESKNLGNQDYINAKKLLLDNGYKLYWEHGDTLAIDYSLPLSLKFTSKIGAFFRKL